MDFIFRAIPNSHPETAKRFGVAGSASAIVQLDLLETQFTHQYFSVPIYLTCLIAGDVTWYIRTKATGQKPTWLCFRWDDFTISDGAGRL